MLRVIFNRLAQMPNVDVLERHNKNRLGVISFVVKNAHHTLAVKMLNDRFGIQMRGGCSCAGTYGHLLLRVSKTRSQQILQLMQAGDMLCKPGWVRLSIHPTMTNAEIAFIMDAIELTATHYAEWSNDYTYDAERNEYFFKGSAENASEMVGDWFEVSSW